MTLATVLTRKALFSALAATALWVLAPACATQQATVPPSAPPEGPQPAGGPSPDRPLPPPAAPALGADGQPVSVPAVIEHVLPSVVNISSRRTRKLDMPSLPFGDPFFRFFFGPDADRMPQEREERGLGSGVVVAQGIVLTNNHVVEGADEITVTTADKHEYTAKTVGTDPKSDLAVLRVEGDRSALTPIAWGRSSALRLGDTVLAIGNPFGVGQTVTMGIVSAVGRADLGIVDYEDFIQTDAAINPGNSGGALVNLRGELVGINTAILSRTGGSMGIGFAIPSDMAQPIMKSLLDNGKVVRGWLGVGIQDVDQDLAQALKLSDTKGVLVTEVAKGTPAEKAGLKQGDVILTVDGKAANSTGELRNLVAAAGAGKTVRLSLVRDGKPRTVDVALGEMPAKPEELLGGGEPSTGAQSAEVGGLKVEALSKELRQRLKVPDSIDHGVVVTGLEPGSAGSQAGITRGDLIIEVDRKKVDGVASFRKAWQAAKGRILIVLVRHGRTLYLVAKR